MAAKKRAAPKGKITPQKKAYLNNLDNLSKSLKKLQLHIRKHRKHLMAQFDHGLGNGG